MADQKISACPEAKCGGKVRIFPSYGGRPGEQTVYYAECEKCGTKVDHLGLGTNRSGIADWNRYAKQRRSAIGGSAK